MGLSFDSVDCGRPGHGPDVPASNWYHQSQQSHHKRQQGPGYTPFFWPSAARPGGLLEPAEAFLDLLLILRLGQFALSDLNQFGSDCGLDETLNEAHECSK
jgi:hypothetical protein